MAIHSRACWVALYSTTGLEPWAVLPAFFVTRNAASCWPRRDLPYGTRSTMSGLGLAFCRYHLRIGISGGEQVPGQGAGLRFQGGNTLYPCVGFCSGSGAGTFAVVCLPASG